MTEKKETTRESGTAPFDAANCVAMMERNMGGPGRGSRSDCAEFFSRLMGAPIADSDCCGAMSQMMAGCCGAEAEDTAAAAEEE